MDRAIGAEQHEQHTSPRALELLLELVTHPPTLREHGATVGGVEHKRAVQLVVRTQGL